MRHFLLLAVSLAMLAAAAPAEAKAPAGFVGTMLDGPAARPSFGARRLARELDVMRTTGIGTLRVVWSWRRTQPYVSWAAVPRSQRARLRDVAGLPLATAPLDRLAGLAARRGIRLLPVTLETPAWNVRAFVPGSPPREVEPYEAFMRALVSRYGSGGAFWREHPRLPRLPVRWWQLWNEPHLRVNWASRRWAAEYTRLLRAGSRGVRADARAKVVMAGLASDAHPVWDNLDALLAEGAGTAVDVVAAHVFTRRPVDVVRALRRVRGTLRAYGLGRLPIALTEWSWPSSQGRRGGHGRLSWETTPRGQAQRVAAALRLLGRERGSLRLATAVHYTWLGTDRGRDWSAWAGLRRLLADGRVVAKPALRAFARAVRALRR
ncbi:MAG TPA: hypothetical protein VF549_19285 [Solirubrobacteraceae bacterium]|jgi:hypothetical protein